MSVSTYKKTKAVLALVAVAILSAVFAFGTISEFGVFACFFLYLGGALFGLAASIATILIARRRVAAGRVQVLIITVVLLAIGIFLFWLPAVQSILFGTTEVPLAYLCINFGLGYFAVGLIFDAHRVFKKRGA